MADKGQERELRRFKWVIGVPYFVQGTSSLTEVPILYFIKYALAMGDAGGQLFDALRSLGWFIKPVWGYLSDRVPLFGYHRKSWYVLMACLALVFWSACALLVLAGVRVPVVYLVGFNLAFATYAFVDVVCDALMVEQGRRLKRVGSFVNFQWTVLALANAGALYVSGWFQERIEAGVLDYGVVFLSAGLPPLATAVVGLRNIDEPRVARGQAVPRTVSLRRRLGRLIRSLPSRLAEFRRSNRVIWLLMLFIFFWKFRPSIGFIERSYLIDVRSFEPASFGTILSVGGLTFFVSILAYRWVVGRFRRVQWHHYLYAMVVIGVVSFPLSFYLYLEPQHPWWRALEWLGAWPHTINPLPGWSRYEWFRLLTETILGFATIPAFVIPLTLAGETVKLQYAGVGYAFLMSLSNVTNMFEGVVGAGLYTLFSRPEMGWLVKAFHASWFDISGVADERTLILEMFVYISLLFTLLTLPFIRLLQRELDRQGVIIHLGGPS